MRFILIISLCLFNLCTYAQKISGNIKDESGKPVQASTAFLYKASDSALVKMSVANNEGVYEFISIKAGRYFLKISNVGFQIKYIDPFEYNGNDFIVPAIVLSKNATTLSKVVI
ncbi:MAG: carboxypeptidase-like regulatory domain-containing protein [Ginsengibacter sp.]